jgi:hypothetical protein
MENIMEDQNCGEAGGVSLHQFGQQQCTGQAAHEEPADKSANSGSVPVVHDLAELLANVEEELESTPGDPISVKLKDIPLQVLEKITKTRPNTCLEFLRDRLKVKIDRKATLHEHISRRRKSEKKQIAAA